MPADNAAAKLEKTVQDIPRGFADEIILVDDSSKDNTVQIARGLGLSVILHNRNSGKVTCKKRNLVKDCLPSRSIGFFQ